MNRRRKQITSVVMAGVMTIALLNPVQTWSDSFVGDVPVSEEPLIYGTTSPDAAVGSDERHKLETSRVMTREKMHLLPIPKKGAEEARQMPPAMNSRILQHLKKLGRRMVQDRLIRIAVRIRQAVTVVRIRLR